MRILETFGWQVISAAGLGFITGVLLANSLSAHQERNPPFQAKAGEVALFLREMDLYWGAEIIKVGDQAALIKLQQRNTLKGGCRLNQKPVRVRLRGRVVGVAMSTSDMGLARELMYAMKKPRFKLGVITLNDGLKLKNCVLRDAVTYVD